ncbi:DpnI domain-containing protein [Geotoga petraea]|uniref:Type II restriction enzyme n=2 Tax=Geotoga petraea TaxID=28234 RepID=A0A1G6MP56_9BACT|nr:DpnI domain-containing protein [Geotoga petraea]SDC57007.1 type II restriction enzyme [Geotoga petraea]
MINKLDLSIAKNYKSKSQITRVITEKWVQKNIFCPNCGNNLKKYENNRPVADFFCDICKEDYELKAKKGQSEGEKIIDGSYSTMIDRITSINNPNFFFLIYNKNYIINNFFGVSKDIFVPEIIEKRKPLSSNARRKGWVGCNILISEIPKFSKIYYIKNSTKIENSAVKEQWQKTNFSNIMNDLKKRSWIYDILYCIDKINKNEFSLRDIYNFESFLQTRHQSNKNIKAKIRQQLQILRDKKFILFLGKGKYKIL